MSAMGFLDDIGDAFRSVTGGVDGDLIANGILGRADLLGVDISGTTIQIGDTPNSVVVDWARGARA